MDQGSQVSVKGRGTITVQVNKQTFQVHEEVINGYLVYQFPVLTKLDKLGRQSFWRIYVIGPFYYRESWIINKKGEQSIVKQFPAVRATPKNVGRANQTSEGEQALFEAYSQWKGKRDELYQPLGENQTEVKVGEGSLIDLLRPMLAQPYEKQNIFPIAASRKLDGVRCMIYEEKGKIMMISRQGKEIFFLDNVRNDAKMIFSSLPNVVLDGELYSHSIPFNVISGAVRSKNKPSAKDDQIEFHLFDLYFPANPGVTYRQRADLLRQIAKFPLKRTKIVDYEVIQNEAEMIEKHNQYVKEGYEGIILRKLDEPYYLGKRVSAILKFKAFKDEEFQIIDVVEGKGTEEGAAVFVVRTNDDQKFQVRPRGDFEWRKNIFQNRDKVIGKMLTVRYQPSSEPGVLPRFPVGIAIRDYE